MIDPLSCATIGWLILIHKSVVADTMGKKRVEYNISEIIDSLSIIRVSDELKSVSHVNLRTYSNNV